MEIKNKLVNTKEYKKGIRLNKKMKKKAKKYENVDITKCSFLEQSLYGPINSKDKTTKNDKNKFLKLNKIMTLLYLFPKSDSKNLYNNFKSMFYENPMNKNIFSTMIDDRFEDFFKNYDNVHNSNSYGSIGHIEPKSISKYISFINIIMFNFSSNYLGIAFECYLTNDILTEFNNAITCKIDDNVEYKKYYIGSKKQIGRTEWNPDIIRKKLLNNNIIEVKCIINDFINHYLKFEKEISVAPISLNLYETNYEITNRAPSIMMSHDMYGYTNEHKFEKFHVWERFGNKSDEHFETDICFECFHTYDNLDRSSNLYIYTEKDNRDLFLVPESIISIYISILHFYKNIEFEKIIAEERNNIFSIYSNKNKKRIYKAYDSFITNTLKYKTLLTDIVVDKNYSNDYLKRVHKFQNERSQKLINDCQDFEKYFENKLMIDNINETRRVSHRSLFVAIISLIIAIIPLIYNYIDNKKSTGDIDKMNNSIKEVNKEIQHNNDYLQEIIKLLQEKTNQK